MLAAAAARLGQLAGAAVWWVLILVGWAHATFVARPMDFFLDTVLGNWEEAVKSAVRESFAWMTRTLNGLSAWVVSLFVDPNFYQSMRAGRRRPSAWQRWWAERAHRGTFNAVVERDGLVVRSRASPSPSPSPQPPAWTSQGSLPRASSSYDQLLYEQQQRQTEILLAAERLHAGEGSPTARPQPRRQSWLRLLWPFGWWRAGRGSTSSLGSSPKARSALRVRRSGSELFDRPSGYAVAESMPRRGLLEEGRVALELAVTAVFDGLRSGLRALLLLPKHPKWEPAGGGSSASRYRRTSIDSELGTGWDSGERRPGRGRSRQASFKDRLARTRSYGMLEDLQVWTVSDCILQAGFPLEEHVVTTEDGYLLHMQRIPRKGARDVVFFQHGVLDTSLGWVSNGVQGSQAYAAWDQGHDVWLGNARTNPPRMHADPKLSGSRYWHFSLNQLGTQDIAAQVAHIHAVKTRELKGGGYGQGGAAMDRTASAGSGVGLRRTYSDSSVAAMHLLRPSPFGDSEPNSRAAYEPALGGAAAGGAAKEQQQQQAGQEALPVSRRTSASLDGGAGVEKWQRRMRSMGLRVQMPSAAGNEAVAPVGASIARSAGEKPAVFKQLPIDPAAPGRQQVQAAQSQQSATSSAGGAAAASVRGDGQLNGPARGNLSYGAADGQPRLEKNCEAGSSSGASEPSDLPALSAGRQGGMGVLRSLSGLPRTTATPVGGTSPSVTPRFSVSAPDHQALTPDKWSVRGVERPGEAEAAVSTQLLLPTASMSGGREGAANPRGLVPAANPQAGSLSQPYRLRAVGHSLGAASLLIYAVHCCLTGRPHHLRRMVLLTPAGFHKQYPMGAFPFVHLVPPLMKLLSWVRGGLGAPVYIPSSLLRYITFKLSHDLQQIPGLNELIRAALRLMLSGDKSEWDRALQMPHYNTYGMPAISLHTGAHLIQLIRTQRFQLYDYGSVAANRVQYGQDEPLDVAEQYHLLRGLPIDLVAGSIDGIIAEANVQAHYEAMKRAGVQVSYRAFRCSHLDVTFGMKEEVRRYVMARLQLP